MSEKQGYPPPGAPVPPPQYGYPAAPGYPSAPNGFVNAYPAPQGAYPPCPPSYDQAMQHPVYYGQPPTQQPVQPMTHKPAYPTQSQPAPIPQYVPAAQFDAGARFTGYAPPSIPPPPPGCTPNAAQLAAMNGQKGPVQIGQKKGGFFKGSGSGGYTFW